MTTPGTDVLLVGPDFTFGESLPERLREWGFQCHFVNTARMASKLLRSQKIDVLLATTSLPDGSGFSLVAALSGLVVTAFLCLPVEDSCFWLPVVERGRPCLGSPALRPKDFARAIRELSPRKSDDLKSSADHKIASGQVVASSELGPSPEKL
jgi:hypothetical protein